VRSIWTVMPKHRNECNVRVHACAQSDSQHRRLENRTIDIEKEHSEAHKEQEKERCNKAGNASTVQER